jgi:hypothetical protein
MFAGPSTVFGGAIKAEGMDEDEDDEDDDMEEIS